MNLLILRVTKAKHGLYF